MNRIEIKSQYWEEKEVGKAKLLIIISAVVVFSFVPMIKMPYEVVVQKRVSEEYTTVEPYTVQEQVREPYQSYSSSLVEEPYQTWDSSRKELGTYGGWVTKFRTVQKSIPVTRYRTVTKDVTEYREVTKTRLVTRPVVETRTKRVSILRYLLK